MPDGRIGILSQLVPPSAKWTADNVPDQTGRVAIITGGHVGVGKEVARVLLSKGAKVYIAAVEGEKADEGIDELKGDTGKDSVFLLHLDLANLDSIKDAADEFLRKESKLHTLYNNESVTYALSDKETVQGYDLIFGTNVLGHFYFTKLLLPALTAAAEKSLPGSVRVVNVSSIAHYMPASEGIRWCTITGPDGPAARRKLGVPRLYGQSKLGNILFSNEFARRYKDSKIVSISVFPGAVNADLGGHAGSFFSRAHKLVGACICFLVSGGDLEALTEGVLDREPRMADVRDRAETGVTRTAERRFDQFVQPVAHPGYHDPVEPARVYYRAITPLYAGAALEASRLSGRYLTAWARITLPSRKALNARLAATLWEWCEARIEEHTKPRPKEDTATRVTVTEITKPEEVAKPKEDAKPEEVTKPKEDTKPEEDTKPKDDAKPKEDAKPEEDAKPKEDSKPKEDVKPEDDAKPKEDSKPKEDVKPEDDAKPKEDSKPKEDVKPEEDAKAKEDTGAKA